MNIHQRLDAIQQKLPTKQKVDFSKLTTEQLRYLVGEYDKPLPQELITQEYVDVMQAMGYTVPEPLKDPISEVNK